MGWGKKLLGGLAVAGGIVSEIAVPGNPAGIAAIGTGAGTIAADSLRGKPPGTTAASITGNTKEKAQAAGSSSTAATPPPKPIAPTPASSLHDSRSQQRGRMLSKYDFKPWSGGA